MAGVFVVAACAVVGSSSVVGMVSVTGNVGPRCWTGLVRRMRTV